MFLNLQVHEYNKDIYPYIKNGIIIDTSVFKIIVDGIVCTRFSKKKSPELDEIMNFLDILKMNNKWGKFFITPHVLTEICRHIRNDYDDWKNYKEIIKQIFPMITAMEEKAVKKDEILRLIDYGNPIIEIGDISIFVIADDYENRKEKIAILAEDGGINNKYIDSKNVMVLNYKLNMLNQL